MGAPPTVVARVEGENGLSCVEGSNGVYTVYF